MVSETGLRSLSGVRRCVGILSLGLRVSDSVSGFTGTGVGGAPDPMA